MAAVPVIDLIPVGSRTIRPRFANESNIKSRAFLSAHTPVNSRLLLLLFSVTFVPSVANPFFLSHGAIARDIIVLLANFTFDRVSIFESLAG